MERQFPACLCIVLLAISVYSEQSDQNCYNTASRKSNCYANYGGLFDNCYSVVSGSRVGITTVTENQFTGSKEIPAPGHTPAEAVIENKTEATCGVAGSYDSIVYCSVCKAHEISRNRQS